MEKSGLQLQSLVKEDGTLELSFATIAVPKPAADEVVVRIEATPINPSDIAKMFGPADMSTMRIAGRGDDTKVSFDIPDHLMKLVSSRLGQALPMGNEGGGVVVAAGESDAAQALMGKTVGVIGGGMYAHYRCLNVQSCLPLKEGSTPRQAASCFVNPLTALSMVEVMRMEGHKALVHTAAASNLGQMLNRICQKDGIDIVNIVRKPEQEKLLRDMGAKYVCDSSSPDYYSGLTAALKETGALLAFDATGGGKLANQILTCMEKAIVGENPEYTDYGSDTHKQIYIYGGLDRSATTLDRTYGFAWSVGGFLLTPFLLKIGKRAQDLRERVANEIDTTFASSYKDEISLIDALSADAIKAYSQQATGIKYLINPQS